MSDYIKVYDGAAKDAAKANISGADFDVDFALIETHIGTKMDKVSGHTTNSVVLLNASGEPISSEVLIDTDGTLAGNSDSAIPTEKAVKTYVDARAGGLSVAYGADSYSTDIEVTDVPAGCERIEIACYALDPAVSYLDLTFGSASGYGSTTYDGAAVTVKASGNTYVESSSLLRCAPGSVSNGIITLTKMDIGTHRWAAVWNLSGASVSGITNGSGRIEVGAELTSIKIAGPFSSTGVSFKYYTPQT